MQDQGRSSQRKASSEFRPLEVTQRKKGTLRTQREGINVLFVEPRNKKKLRREHSKTASSYCPDSVAGLFTFPAEPKRTPATFCIPM